MENERGFNCFDSDYWCWRGDIEGLFRFASVLVEGGAYEGTMPPAGQSINTKTQSMTQA